MRVRLGIGETACWKGWVKGGGGIVGGIAPPMILVGGNIVHFRFVNDRPRAVPAGLRSPTG